MGETDLISRQDAIDAVKELCLHYTPTKSVRHPHINFVVEELERLPSAQPEDKCGECDAWNQYKNYPRHQWIPVSERLPEDDTLMLVNYIDERPDAMDIWIGWHEMENVWYIDGEEHCRERGNEVIAWMPLPEPWKGEQE